MHRCTEPIESGSRSHLPGGDVLEALEGTTILRDEPVALLCPGCGTVVAAHQVGLPSDLVYVREWCPSCEVELRRWSIIAVPAADAETVTSETLAAVTQGYWDEHLWAGITTVEGQPRNREFTELYRERASAYDWDWDVSCPLCRYRLETLPDETLDYHHWSRGSDGDPGICLCRECHNAVNARKNDTKLDWTARELGLRDLHDLQIARLGVLETQFGSVMMLEGLARQLQDRYNLPVGLESIEQVLAQAFGAPELWEWLEVSHEQLDAGESTPPVCKPRVAGG